MSRAEYALGLEVDWREQRPAPADASRAARMANDWPTICRSVGCFKKVGDDSHRAWIPPLLDQWRDGHIEYFDVAVPAVFITADATVNTQNPMAMLPSRLAAACGANAAESILLPSTRVLRSQGLARCNELFGDVDVPVRRLALSYFVLPTDLKLDPVRIPPSPVEFYLGQLSDGSDSIWNAAANPHACIAGATGSGKTRALESLLLQNHWKGGQLRVCTAKLGDRVIDQFTRFPQHTVLTGLRDGPNLVEDLLRVREALRGVRSEVSRRQAVRAEHRVDAWHDVPAEVRGDASTVFVVIDESRSFFPIRENREPEQVRDIKKQIAHEVDHIAQLARQEDVFLIIATQSPYADTLATGFVQDQIHLWYTVRKLQPKWLATVYGQSESVNPKKLVSGDLPQGRAVVRGVTAPDNPFGEEAVRDGLMQVAHLDPDDPDDEAVRELLLSGGTVQFPRRPTAEQITEPDPDSAAGAGVFTETTALPVSTGPQTLTPASVAFTAMFPIVVFCILAALLITGMLP